MFRKMMAVVSVAAVAAAGSMAVPMAATAKSGPAQYAKEQCGGYWAVLGYPSYDECYMFAVQYYLQQTGGGGGGGGGGGMTSPGDIPGYTPGQGCGATRITCNPGT